MCVPWLLWASLALAQAQQIAAIASAHPLATQAGETILQRGGNAFDAAVAVAAALAVVEPYSSGLGGGGFFLLHRAADNRQVMVDARETAPAGVKREHYLDASGNPVRGATMLGGTASGIPGTPAGLVHVAQRYGTLPLAETLAPAIALARDGFAVDGRYARIAKIREGVLRKMPEASRIFLADGQALTPGYLLKQPELAQTLTRLANEGTAGFYGGSVARALVDGGITLDSYTPQRIADPAIRPLMQKIRVHASAELRRIMSESKGPEAKPSKIRIRAAGGREFVRELMGHSGHPDRPQNERRDVINTKLDLCAAYVQMTTEQRERIRAAWWGVAQAADIRAVIQTMAGIRSLD